MLKSQLLHRLYALIILAQIIGCASPSLRSPRARADQSPEHHHSRELGENDSLDESNPTGLEEFSQQGVSPGQGGEGLREGSVDHFSSRHRSNLEPHTRRTYQGRSRLTKEDFIDSSAEEGSLWASNGQTNYFFTKNKVRNPGELITLLLEADLYKEVGQEVKKSLSPQEQSSEISALVSTLRQKALEDLKLKGASSDAKNETQDQAKPTPPRLNPGQSNQADSQSLAKEQRMDPMIDVSREIQDALRVAQSAEDIDRHLGRIKIQDVNIFPSLELLPGESMNGQIVERYQNGNYKVRVFKKIFYKNGKSRFLKVIGTIKGSDITEDTDLINSGKLYEYKIEVSQ